MDNFTRKMDINLKENIRHTNCDLVLIKNLVTDVELARCLAREVQNLEYNYKLSDLLSLHQTVDFELSVLPHHLFQFVLLLNSTMRPYVENVFGFKSKPEITITASLYKKGDYLLCHDDLYCDRQVAFVYYLTENWTEANGGALRFFNHDEQLQPKINDYKEVFLPVFNSFVLFRVSDSSHHEVQQVFGDKLRLSINGWYRCDNRSPPMTKPLFTRAQMLQFYSYSESQCCLNMLRNGYLNKSIHQDVRESFCNNGSLMIDKFFTEEVYHQCVSELENCTTWKIKGPANHRKYEVIEVTQEGNEVKLSANLPVLTTLIRFMISPSWLNYLSCLTGSSFAVFDENKFPPACTVEIQCWKEGFYSLMADNDAIQMLDALELTLFFKVKSEGLEDSEDNPRRANGSGNIIHSFSTPFGGENYHKAIALMKMRRMRQQVRSDMFELQNPRGNHRKNSTQKSLQVPRITRATNEFIKRCVKEKMKRVAQYRLQRYESETIPPHSNSGLLTVNSFSGFKMNKCWPYIQMTDPKAEPQTRFYSLTFTYIIENN